MTFIGRMPVLKSMRDRYGDVYSPTLSHYYQQKEFEILVQSFEREYEKSLQIIADHRAAEQRLDAEYCPWKLAEKQRLDAEYGALTKKDTP